MKKKGKKSSQLSRTLLENRPGCYPLGTAFAIKTASQKYLLTTYHTIDMHRNCDSWFVTKTVHREGDGKWKFANEQLVVDLVTFDADLDVAILSVSQRKFKENEMMKICPPNLLPNQENEPNLKVYYFAIADIESEPSTPLNFASTEWKRMYAISETHLYLRGGLCAGSSGGAVINGNGLAVAMHIESFNPSKSFTDIENEQLVTKKGQYDMVIDSLDSLSNTHSSSQKCLLLSCKGLLAVFQNEHINIQI